MAETNHLYNSIVDITQDYLGPAAGRFIDRQISNHLGKQPTLIKPEDMTKLTEWLRVAMSILTDDQSLISDYFARIDGLTKNHLGSRRRS
ncbi:MAG TPA: hypothetical protein VLE69_01605 [Candidatus Saccharimonadales bacterium]|nr:hypothetical protein [Candidatus Saccharimonadales bacterium]